MMKVFLCEYIHPEAKKLLEENAEIISDSDRMKECDAVISRNLSIDRTFMERCPNLKVIGIHGTGTDGVDLKAAAEYGIRVISAPGENAASVAELIVSFLLVTARKICLADRMIRSGKETGSAPALLSGKEISGKTFGMVGCGTIALKAAKMLRDGFGMRIIGYSPSLTREKAERLEIGRCESICEVFEKSDFVSLGMPLNASTKDIITGEILHHAKPGCILINTSRGGVIDEAALYEALTDGTLRAAAGDVFAKEPLTSSNPLISLDNFVATPHIGANTEEALYRVGMSCVRQILAVSEGKQPEHEILLS